MLDPLLIGQGIQPNPLGPALVAVAQNMGGKSRRLDDVVEIRTEILMVLRGREVSGAGHSDNPMQPVFKSRSAEMFTKRFDRQVRSLKEGSRTQSPSSLCFQEMSYTILRIGATKEVKAASEIFIL